MLFYNSSYGRVVAQWQKPSLPPPKGKGNRKTLQRALLRSCLHQKRQKVDPLVIAIRSSVPMDSSPGHLKPLQKQKAGTTVSLNYKDRCKLTLAWVTELKNSNSLGSKSLGCE